MQLIKTAVESLIFKYRVIRTRSHINKNSKIWFHSSVTFDRNWYFTARGGEIIIDRDSVLNTQVILNADIGGKIHISSDCLIGPRVIFRTVNHKFTDIRRTKKLQGQIIGDILIGKNVWVGANVTVLSGVTIGENSVIGAGAVVTKSIPKNSVAVGIPAKVIKKYA